ncbi:hypothetical protein BDV33DRAFT_187421 [Aspergillus novoparasiticus]|uniref:Uncharacterized protein n=1 Tax=Aspergillus novoparasiticus TaxID=986946 RepID=A0A5N6F761_9EURO|nr:hypothetical protein BDV33DRAFT_187421 [Aspergillus novoparasiticus]
MSLYDRTAFTLASLFLIFRFSVAALPPNLVGLVSVRVAPSSRSDWQPNLITKVDVPGYWFYCADEEGVPCQVSVAPKPTNHATSEPLESLPAITVSSSGDSSYVPPKTKRQPATQVKRAPTSTNTDVKYRKQQQIVGRIPEVGQGYAIKIGTDENSVSGSKRNEVSGQSFPDHYLIGNTIILKFDSACCDIQLEHEKDGVLGHIKPGLTYVEIERDGHNLVTTIIKA